MSSNLKWEMYFDEDYYDLFAVRPVGDNDFNSSRLFHFALMEDARSFMELAEKAFIAIPSKSEDEKTTP